MLSNLFASLSLYMFLQPPSLRSTLPQGARLAKKEGALIALVWLGSLAPFKFFVSILSRLIEISPLHLTREPIESYAECERTLYILISITERMRRFLHCKLLWAQLQSKYSSNKASCKSDSLPLLLVKTKMSQFTTTMMGPSRHDGRSQGRIAACLNALFPQAMIRF